MKSRLPFILLLLCAGAFVLGLAQLFKLRFDSGDVYPPYSSLRLDPLGSSAFYESLERLPDMTVRRDFSASDQLPGEPQTAYLHLAGNPYDWDSVSEQMFRELASFLARGGRLVVAFSPETEKREAPAFIQKLDKLNEKDKKDTRDKADQKTKSDKSNRKHPKIPGGEDPSDHFVQLSERWGVHFDFFALEPGDGDAYVPVSVQNTSGLPLADSIAWHSGLVLTNLDKAWRVIYSRGTNAVLAERKFGPGSVVFATDSYFLSNEAMSLDRHADLLAWLVGSCRDVVFDEAHLGITENPGVAVLIRKYRLHSLVLGLLLLAGLFIWKNSLSFVPPPADEKAGSYVAGKDSTAGFVNLLRRHVPDREVLAVCLVEWEKSFGHGKLSPSKLERVRNLVAAENALPPRERDPVRAYQAICRTLHK